eukprot:363419-Chlamydomonas_euryale.AAC.19
MAPCRSACVSHAGNRISWWLFDAPVAPHRVQGVGLLAGAALHEHPMSTSTFDHVHSVSNTAEHLLQRQPTCRPAAVLQPVLNDSADKLAFETEKVYDASAFEFSEEQKPPPA